MKLSKTQQYLLEQARKYGGRFSVESISGKGSHGGRIKHGSRQRDALFTLEKLGLVRIVHRESDTEFNRGYGIHCNSFVFEIIE